MNYNISMILNLKSEQSEWGGGQAKKEQQIYSVFYRNPATHHLVPLENSQILWDELPYALLITPDLAILQC